MAATFNLLPVRVITPRPNGYLRSALTRRRLVSGAANPCCSRPFVLYIRSDPQRIGDLLTASVARVTE